MKRVFSLLLIAFLIFSLPLNVYAIGSGNIDGGGGGMGNPINGSSWSPGNDGVRITVVRASDGTPVTTPIDMTNKSPSGVQVHFGKVSKTSYTNGRNLAPAGSRYTFVNPGITMPRIISTSGSNNIAEIKRYFCSEYTLKRVAHATGMDYNTLIGGSYKILLEPIAYVTYRNIFMALTAHEAALYDETTGGQVRYDLQSLTHQNQPFAMFLETADLGYPAYSGATNKVTTNATIKSSLGLGIVRFGEPSPGPSLSYYDYEYRVNTDVITSVFISGGQSDPDNPVTVNFYIGGSRYTVSNVYYPEGDGQLAWIRWRTPSKPCEIVITVNATGSGVPSLATINARVVNMDENPPPNPVADDRNDSFSRVSVPSRPHKTSASWGVWTPRWRANWEWRPNWIWVENWEWHSNMVWVTSPCDKTCPRNCKKEHGGWEDHGHMMDKGWWEDRGWWEDNGWWEFDHNAYTATLTGSMNISADTYVPNVGEFRAGYGIGQSAVARVSSDSTYSSYTNAQTAVSFFPEFRYEGYWRMLQLIGGSVFKFKANQYSTYGSAVHFTPVWFPNGSYTVNTWILDCWTPAGMLSMNLSKSITISGSVWDDWHIAPAS